MECQLVMYLKLNNFNVCVYYMSIYGPKIKLDKLPEDVTDKLDKPSESKINKPESKINDQPVKSSSEQVTLSYIKNM
jgi:hypothetical protein